MLEAQRALFRRHGKALLDGLDEYLVPRGARGPLFRLSWEFGFLWTANVARDGHTVDEFVAGLRALLAHPSAHFLHVLALGAPPDNDWDPVLQALTESGERPIRMLFLGDSASTSLGDPRPAWRPLGHMAGLWQVLPHLRCLALRGGTMSVGRLDLPALRELVIETPALQRETLAAIGSRAWPELEKLELWFGDRRCTCTLADVEPIFDGSIFPRLRHLALRNCVFVDRLCHALGGANITKQLHVLDLSLGALTETGTDSLLRARRAFEHLAVLDLHHHYVNEEAMAGVSTLARFVDVSGGHYDFDDDPEPGPPKVWLDA